MKRLWQRPGLVFVLVVVWKFLLGILTVQPIPANDAFFYDGPVVNLLLHGQYTNPSLQLALPISATEVFSAYPPLYQFVLLGWMTLFGTSAVSAILFHVTLFAVYAWLVYSILNRLETPVYAMHIAGAFLLSITFHDRPDSLAHVFGMLAIAAWLNTVASAPAAFQSLNRAPVVFVLLCLATSLQIGAAYGFVIVGSTILYCRANKQPLPLKPLLSIGILPLATVLLVMAFAPRWWQGFLEHARQTPTFVGFHFPSAADLLKVIRTVPGVLVLLALLSALRFRLFPNAQSPSSPGLTADVPAQDLSRPGTALDRLFLVLLAAAGIVIITSLAALAANSVAIANYLQPLLVGMGLLLIGPRLQQPLLRRVRFLLIGGAGLASLRAIALTTWGVLLATDVGYDDALKRTRAAFDRVGPSQTAVVSSAFLYDAAASSKARLVHSDWLEPARPHGQPVPIDEAMRRVQPSLLVLTQFDYYRRYKPILDALKKDPNTVRLRLQNRAVLPAPDSSPLLQRVVQHLSWAPVIVDLSWQTPPSPAEQRLPSSKEAIQ